MSCLFVSYLTCSALEHIQDVDVTLIFECKRHALSAIVFQCKGAKSVNFHSALLHHKWCHLLKEKHSSLHDLVRGPYYVMDAKALVDASMFFRHHYKMNKMSSQDQHVICTSENNICLCKISFPFPNSVIIFLKHPKAHNKIIIMSTSSNKDMRTNKDCSCLLPLNITHGNVI